MRRSDEQPQLLDGGTQPGAGPLLDDLRDLLRDEAGASLNAAERAIVEARLRAHDLPDLASYLALLRQRPEEAHALARELRLASRPSFYSREALADLEITAIPQLFADKAPDEVLRAWLPGCATGEAAYVVAIMLRERADQLASPPAIQIFATDSDELALATARAGWYAERFAALSPERLRRFFSREQQQYHIKKSVRDLVVFARHHVLRDPPFARLDLIVCAHLLRAFAPDEQEQILQVFHQALRPGGYLLLGAGESSEQLSRLFVRTGDTPRLFRRRDVAPARPPVSDPSWIERRWPARPAATIGPVGELHLRLVAQHAPTSVLVDAAYDIIHLSKRDDRLFRLPQGLFAHNLLEIVPEELRLPLRGALLGAARKRASVETPLVWVALADGPWLISALVQPLDRPERARGCFLVIFEERDGQAPSAAPIEAPPDEQEQWWLTIDEYETAIEGQRRANKDLQAVNEQLRALAEELETSQDQLRSTNEELQATNRELRRRIIDLTHANNDLSNLMAAADIATIFLDRALRIARFTPQAQDLFNLIPADLGRPLAHITHALDYDELRGDAAHVLATLQGVEREIRRADGLRWYLARLRPYRTADDRIEGVVLTFVDISARKQAERALRRARDGLELRVAERTRELTDANLHLEAEVAERARLETSRRELLQALVWAQEEERRRIARELHDQLGQSLSALRLGLAALASDAAGVDAREELVDRLQRITAQLDEDVDRLALELRPSTLDDLGLLSAVQQHVEEWAEGYGIAADLQVAGLDDSRLPPEVEIVIYRVIQEALTNVLKHAAASHVSIILERSRDQLSLIVEDDGRGFDLDAPQARGKLGLLGMQERVALVGGTCTIETAPGAGTTLFARIPLPAAPPTEDADA